MAMDPVSIVEANPDSGKPRAPGLFALLGTRRFLPLFLTQSLGAFNASLFVGALIELIVMHPAPWIPFAPSTLIALAFGVFVLPFLLFASLAGQLADRYAHATLAQALKALEIPATGIAVLGFALPSLALLFCALGFWALLLVFFTPLKHAVVSRDLRDGEFVGGNALLAAGIVAALIAGVVMGRMIGGEGGGWIAIVGLPVAIIGYAASRSIPVVPAANSALRLRFKLLAETARGFRSLRSDRTLLFALIGISWFWLAGALLLFQMQRLAGVGAEGVWLPAVPLLVVLAGFGAGLLLGAKISEGSVEFGLVPLGAIGQAVFALDLACSFPDLLPLVEAGTMSALFRSVATWRVLFDLFAFGVCGASFLLPLYVRIQSRSVPEPRSRILSCGLFLCAMSLLFAAAVALVLPDPIATFSVMAVCSFIVAWLAYRREAHLTLRFLTWLLIHAFYRIGKIGFEHIPKTGPAVLVCNHVSFVDSVVIMAAIRRPIRFVMDHRIHQTPVVGFLFRHSRTIPIATAKDDPAMKEAAFEEVARALRKGELIGLFPEGRITHTGEINHFRYGVGRIVEETPVPVVPMALRGLWGSFFSRRYGPAMSKPSLLRWLAKIELVVGHPVPPEQGSPESLQEIVTDLRGGMV